MGVFFTFLYRLIFNRGHSRFYTLTTLKTIQTNPKPTHLKYPKSTPKHPKNISHSHSILYRKPLPNLNQPNTQIPHTQISISTQFPKSNPKSHPYLSQKISTKSNHPIYPPYSLIKRIWLFWLYKLLYKNLYHMGGILHFTTYLLIYNYTYYIYKLVIITIPFGIHLHLNLICLFHNTPYRV